MALTLLHWTPNLVYINHELAHVEEELLQKLRDNGIEYVHESIEKLIIEGDQMKGVVTASGKVINGERAFVAFGGNEVRSDLARQLGVELSDNRHVIADPRTKMTRVPNVWADGDLLVHSEQSAIAIGDGLQAAIWMHKSLINRA